MRFVCLIVGVLSMALFGDAAELKVSHRASQTAEGGRDAASPFADVRPVKEDTKVETLVDFSKAKENDFSMAMGAFLDRRAPKQLEVGPHGLTVRVDDAREKPGTPWATLTFPRSLSSVDFAGRSFVLVFAGKPQGRITRSIALNVTDANGETFQFEPKSVESDRTAGDLRFVFDTASLSGKPGWGGKVNDGKMDRPARLSGLNFHYRRSGSGECVLKSVESVPAESASLRTTVSVEPISTDVQSPGAAPFHGAQELVFVVEPAFVGRATLTLSTESKGMAIQGRKVQHEADSDMGRIVFPVRQSWTQQYQFLELKCGNETAGGELGAKYRIVRAEGRFLQTKAEAMRLEVDTKNELHICRDESERPELLVTNPCAEPIAWKTEFVLSDVFGREIKIPFERLVAAGETVRVPVPWPLPAKGLWFVNARVLDVDGSVAEKETRFAFVDRHETTPLVDRSKFRFGIHYHGTKYWPDKIDKTIAALVAAGAKFTRCDYSHMWADIEPRPGEFHWEKSDAMIDKLRAAGLSLDIIIQNIPSYAFDPETLAKVDGWRKKGYRVRGSCLKTKPGLFRDFCEKYARRYGTKIDYYEVGNEWDLSSTESFPHEVALAIQREAYEGLHAGCPDVCVTPNGWAYPFTEPNATPDRWNLGIMEFFADHPEVYDCWALHCHGSFAKYVNYLDGGWKDLRERTKMKTRGWISNETANSVAFGNEIPVSRQVWQKPLWAWSRGCEAYIWYNLRATGWFDGHEPGYGVITADFHPRATYAAFAALTAIFQNLDFDGAIHSHGLRNLLRFRGTSQVLAEGGRVLAGWDDAAGADEIRLIRIRTDAKSVELSDHMGNRTPVKIEQGVVVFPMTLSPQALILRGASFAEAVDAKELTRPLSGPKRIDLSQRDRAPDFTITDKEHFRSFYEANPPFAHRLWTNAADLSAKVWFDRADGRPIVRVEVCDDKPTSGDRVEATVETSAYGRRTFALERVSEKDGVSVYTAKLPVAESSFGFDLRVHEDDGEGPDGYLMLCREGEDPVPVELLAPVTLAEGFANPPDKSKPWTYWLWMNGLTDEQTIVEELEDIKRLGFGGILLNDARGYWEDDDHIVTPPAEHAWMSAPQVRKYALAMRTARRLGLEMTINTSPNGGKLCGPWKVGADAPKRLLVSTRPLCPGESVADEPPPAIAHFKPIALFAIRTSEPLAARDWYAGGDGLFSMAASSGKRIDVGHDRRPVLAAEEVAAGWRTPAGGHWSLVRFGFATMEGREYDVDILDPAAIRRHFDRFFAPLKAEFGDLIGTTLTGLYSVSWEGAVPNWSPDFEADFRKLTGEDLRPNLPLLAGFTLPGRDIEAFMTKYRRARNDMFRQNFYGTFAEIAHREGLHWFSESGGPWVRRKEVFGEADQLEFLSVNDVPQGEFWEMAGYGLRPFVRHVDARTGRWHIRGAVNAAHIYDKPLVSVEAFTHMMQHWSVDPATLKPVGDIGFADGANRYLWHTYTSSPARFGVPGIEYFAGSHINRNVTWHDDAKAFVTYLGRCQHMLQAGRPVTDIAVLGGNRTYSHWGRFRDRPSDEPHLDVTIPKGYAYDLVNDDALARNPALLKRYKVVYDVRKPENRGKTVPVGSLMPDAQGPFDWAHRRTDGEEWYFISGEGAGVMTFRATAPAVETWDAVSGERRAARAEATGDGRTRVALDLPVGGSVFVMFLPRPTTDLPPRDSTRERTVADVRGPWQVGFSYPRGISAEAPGPVTLGELVDFTTREDLKFFSGTATYRATFDFSSDRSHAATGPRQVRLSLGTVLSGLAHVYLNGTDCGTVWCAPWEADVTAALKDGGNDLEIRYVNNWMNRLTGDCELPASARVTKSDLHYWTNARTLDKVPWDDYFDIRPTPFSGPAKGDPLQPSGILGPVRIRTVGGREK